MADHPHTPNAEGLRPRLPPAVAADQEERMKDPSYQRTQDYKKRVYSRFSPEKPMNIRENTVMLPDGTIQATGPSQDAMKSITAIDAAKAIRIEDFTEFHRLPCVRESQLPAIGGGALLGAAAKVFGASLWKSTNYAMGTWVVVGFGMYQYCQHNRRAEKDGVKRAVDIMREKAEERREQAMQARRLKTEQEEERKRRKEEQEKRWYGLGRFKFW
ncbi:hypothetical protein EJ05DRAFT_476548 [Pseudovirgaria hyperparasitica]|uniref:Cytochrome c oxidase assembly protein COX20, mitochondrial n=1 Tax=Pseudovirgaria hyperparasitica TaxID=470096 RepID=A0A6A6WAY9_9PEZI|nr:uncharacterized protein EJ05DRAFT_476548 [Pseudovirgaria hyperparasitica]KAF2758291.1 hypothetical protein EJ05DRAFT_476548 [Pseudovirgaria hyperparasitica]